jgi:ethanolamine utilization protein EutN
MFVAKVIGNVWATRRHPGLKSATMLLAKPLGADGKPCGEAQLVIDTQGAGVGDTVLIVDEGGSARKILKNSKAPVRTVIAGIVDKVHIDKRG